MVKIVPTFNRKTIETETNPAHIYMTAHFP